MNSKTFVNNIKVVAAQDAVKGTMLAITRPPGRRPTKNLVELSEWFHHMAPNDREAVEKVAQLAAEQAVYNFLSVLDGLAAIEPIGPKGKLELYYDNGQSRTLLNDNESEYLTALFKSETERTVQN